MKNSDILAGIRDQAPGFTPPAHVANLRFNTTLALETYTEGEAVCRWRPTEDFAIPGPGGFIFGGYVAAVTDSVAHFTTMTILADGQSYSTADLRVSYFKPFLERSFRVLGRVVTRTRTQAHVEIEFFNDSGALCAKATLVQRIRPMEAARPA